MKKLFTILVLSVVFLMTGFSGVSFNGFMAGKAEAAAAVKQVRAMQDRKSTRLNSSH